MGSAETHRLFRRVASLSCVALIFVCLAPPATAEPVGSGQVATAPTLGLRALGVNPTLSFYGLQGEQSITLPVPPGLSPEALTATVELPFPLRRELPFDPPIGTISVIQDGRTISRVDVPAADNVPTRFPLTGAEVRDNAVTVAVRTNLVPPEGYCPSERSDPLRLNGVAVEYAGVEVAPTTVADFLPPVLQRLNVFLPPVPTRTESDAAVRMTAAVIAHYGDQPTTVAVTKLNGDEPLPPAAPFERQLVIREGPKPAVELLGSVGVPALQITGPPEELTNQARLLSSGNLIRVALSSKAVAGPLKDSPQLSADTATLRALGQSGQSATALANPQVNIGLDQTQLGRSVHGVRVQLKGSYTPLPSNLNGQVVVSANGEQIDRWPAEASGAIDRWVDVPDRLLQRYTNLSVAIDAAGNTGGCGESQPLTLTIDGDSTVSTAAAKPPIPAGFQSLPQALMPRVTIGITSDAFADTARAATIIAGLQRLSALPLDTTVTPLQDAIASPDPAVLIAAQQWTDDQLKLPVDARNDVVQLEGSAPTGEPTSVTLDPRLRFGSLQAVQAGDRTVLVATSNEAPAELDALLDWLNADPRRWDGLKGSALIQPAGRDPVAVTLADAPEPKPTVPQGNSTRYWLLGAGVIAAVLLGSGVIYLRTRNEPRS